MATFVTGVLVLAFFGAVMTGLAVAARRRQGRRVSASVAGPFEEMWHPAAHRARVAIEVHDERVAEAPAPGDDR
jgi:hypothetical protein